MSQDARSHAAQSDGRSGRVDGRKEFATEPHTASPTGESIARPAEKASLKESTIERRPLSALQLWVKNLVDRIGAALLLVAFSPFIAAVGIFIWAADRGPIFHRRRVLGQAGPFDALKLRTMVPNADALLLSNPHLREKFQVNFKLQDDPRITRVGRFLRKYSIDEIPQLWNVLVGQMSLIGPRMKTAEEFLRYGEAKDEVLSFKPGMTGLWQVTARHSVSYDERVRLDCQYVRDWSLLLDCEIVLRTLALIFKGRGDYEK